jgi:hypothetical protein
MISYCGIVCTDCPAYRLTQAGDTEGLAALAGRLTELGRPHRPEDMPCDGCLVRGGRLVPYCRECAARLCGMERGLPNCAHCEDFGCARLLEVWKVVLVEDARPRLERLHARLAQRSE